MQRLVVIPFMLLLLAGATLQADKLEGDAAKDAKARCRDIKKEWKKLTKAEKLPRLTELSRLPEASVAKFLLEVVEEDTDDDTASCAAHALVRHNEADDAKDLLKLLTRAKTPERKAAIARWLGGYGETSPLSDLKKLALLDDACAPAATQALADIGTKESWAAIEATAAASKSAAAKLAAVTRLLAAGDARGTSLLAGLGNLEDAAAAAHAAVGTDLETDALRPVLALAQKKPNLAPGQRPHFFGSLLARVRKQTSHDAILEAWPRLDKSLDIETGWWRVSVCRAQLKFSDAANWLDSDKPETVINGLRLLQRLPTALQGDELKQAGAALAPLLTHADPNVAMHAVLTCAVTAAAPTAFKVTIASWLKSDQPLRRACSLLAAGRAGLADHAARAIELLRDETWFVGSAALEYLLCTRPKSAAGAVLELAKTQGEGRLFAEAIALLVDLTGQDQGDDLEKWQKLLETNPEFEPAPRKRQSLRGVPYARMKARTAATFYGLEVESTNVEFCLDRSVSMISPVRREPLRPDFGTRKSDVIQRRPEVKASMRDGFLPRFHVAACELSAALDGMSQTARFGIHLFNTDPLDFAPGRTVNNSENRRKAVNWMLSTSPQGGTDIQAALLATIEKGQADTIVLLSDGEPTSLGILEQISRANAVRRLNILVVSIHEKAYYRHYQDALAARDFGRIVDAEPSD